MSVVTLAQASTIVDAALKKGRDTNCAPLTVAVLDAGGHLVAFKREDKSGMLRFDIAFGKAWGALGMGFGSRTLASARRQDPAVLHHAGGRERRAHGHQSRRRADPRRRRRHRRRGRDFGRHLRQGRSLRHRRHRGRRPQGRSRQAEALRCGHRCERRRHAHASLRCTERPRWLRREPDGRSRVPRPHLARVPHVPARWPTPGLRRSSHAARRAPTSRCRRGVRRARHRAAALAARSARQSPRPRPPGCCAISASKRSRNSRACALKVRRAGWITTNSACSGGSTIGLTTQIALADVVHRDQARQHRHPVGARDEFERADHGVHLQHRGDLDAVGLEIGLEVAAADIVGPGHDDLQRPAVGEPHRRERRRARACGPTAAFRGRARAGATSSPTRPSNAGTTAKSSSSASTMSVSTPL